MNKLEFIRAQIYIRYIKKFQELNLNPVIRIIGSDIDIWIYKLVGDSYMLVGNRFNHIRFNFDCVDDEINENDLERLNMLFDAIEYTLQNLGGYYE